MFYRLSKADFKTFEGAWDKKEYQCDVGENVAKTNSAALNQQDGRAYQMSIRDKRINTQDTTQIKYLDYPEC